MKEKLTLKIEKDIIKKAEHYARKQGTSISKIVEAYLETLSDRETDHHQFGTRPVDTGIKDGSENHNRYIYSSKK